MRFGHADFCVSWSALDAVKEGFKTFVLEDACRVVLTLEVPWQLLAAAVERQRYWRQSAVIR